MIRIRPLLPVTAATLILVAACVAPAASPSGSPPSSATPSRPPASASAPTIAPSFEPSGAPTTAPSVEPGPASAEPSSAEPSSATTPTWSKKQLVRAGSDCGGFTATIDPTGRTHAVVVCDGGIRYLTSVDRVTWHEDSIVPAIDAIETDPQVTTDGDRVYVAFTRLAPEDGGCGDDGLRDLGVFVQSKPLAGGAWSDQVKLGENADHLQSFRVADGAIVCHRDRR